jgi:hypothetical protein
MWQIDLALVEGCFTLSEIAKRVSEVTKTECTEKRVLDHFEHLEDVPNGNMDPHHLKLKKEKDKWSFDVEWIRQRVKGESASAG